VSRRRADTLLAERGLADSRSAAAATVRAGRVRLGPDGPEVSKPGQLLPEDAELFVRPGDDFASRGGVKLENALRVLPVEIEGRKALDVGASTGGFTDCLLRHGAESVIALDVGYGQLDWRLRNDPRVTVMERVNARHLEPGDLPYEPDLITFDVSFISLGLLLAPLTACSTGSFDLLALVKPQFELGRERVGSGGVIRSAEDRRDAIRGVATVAGRQGLVVRGLAPSGLPGPKGNLETFLWLARDGEAVDLEPALAEADV
jgi:23S rRNA (cytidine1920-2'-O)/16S rRNA (cytidine1409-2'-O)-methyltransferase